MDSTEFINMTARKGDDFHITSTLVLADEGYEPAKAEEKIMDMAAFFVKHGWSVELKKSVS